MMKKETSTTGNLEESAYAVCGKLTRNSILANQEGIYDKKKQVTVATLLLNTTKLSQRSVPYETDQRTALPRD